MRRFTHLWLLIVLGCMSQPANSDILVLVHGYLGSASSWEESGVNAILQRHGWKRANLSPTTAAGVKAESKVKNPFYAIDLPSLAPVRWQADLLGRQLMSIHAAHPQQSMVIVGHSAGGVVARMLLVLNPVPSVKALITIASPHLGTSRAVQAMDATDDSLPVRLVKRAVAGEIYDVVRSSREVLMDLAPAIPGSMLYWLNQQAHPDISYISIVRPGPVGLGDELVPAFSQDMNNVPTLRGKTALHLLPVGHQLQQADGTELVKILRSIE